MPIRVIRLRHKQAPPLGGCRWCGHVRDVHPGTGAGLTWTLRHGYGHTYEKPTWKQIASRFSARFPYSSLLDDYNCQGCGEIMRRKNDPEHYCRPGSLE